MADRLDTYLNRIGLVARPPVSAEGLAQVQAAHRRSIPFENLDIPLGRGVDPAPDAVFAKLVSARRGGYCFEHNRLLADMLVALGFDARILLARVLLGDPTELSPRTHCLVLVQIEGQPWIADAGFGGSYAPPMSLYHETEAQSGDGASHRLTRLGDEGGLPGSWLLERRGPKLATDGRVQSDDAWERQFAFDLAKVAQADLALGNHWAATHPSSRFTNVTVASLCLPDGFASLVDRRLTVWRKGQEAKRQQIDTPQVYREVLAEQFGIALTETDMARLPLF